MATVAALAGTAAAAKKPSPAPGVPNSVTALARYTSMTISWTPPTYDGSGPIVGYRVSGNWGNVASSCAGSATSCTVTGLRPGRSYSVKVQAENSSKTGQFSPSIEVKVGLADPPTGVTGERGNAAALVSWTPPALNAGVVTGYTVTASPGGQTCTTATASPPATDCTVSGLANGTSYTFTVSSSDAYGNSVSSVASAPVTPATFPGAPTGTTGTSYENAQALVSWTAPNDGGSPPTYTVTADPGGGTCTTATTSCTVTGLTNGDPYTFTVVATNVVGSGPASAPSAPATPSVAPDPPTGVAVTSGDGSATVSWTAPADDGGNAITGYTVTTSPGGSTCSPVDLSVLSCSISGLSATTAYTFTVTATNPSGTSAGGWASLFVPGCVPAPRAELAGCNFTDINLSGVDLDRTDLTGSNFTDANLTGADLDYDTLNNVILNGADLVGAYLYFNGTAYDGISAVGTTLPTGFAVVDTYLVGPSVDISGVDLSGGNFSSVDLSGVTLTDDDFAGADLSGVDLDHTDLTGSNLTDADMTGADLDYDTLNNVTLDGADLAGAYLYTNGAAYNGISAVGTTFPTGFRVVDSYLVGPGANISGVDFSGGDFSGVDLGTGTLDDDNFSGADLSGVDLDRTDLTGSNFTDANLTGADLDYDTLNNVTLDGADLAGAYLYTDGAAYDGISAVGTTFPTGFAVVDTYLVGPGANISGVDFSGGDFSGVDLSTGTLDDNFTGADLSGVDFDHTDLTGSNFTDANLTGAIFVSTTCPDGTNSDADSGTCVNNL